MKFYVLFLSVLLTKISYTQHQFRFSIYGGFNSFMFWGLKNFEDVKCPNENDVYRIYEHEVYNLNYGNFRGSKNYIIGISVNWFNKPDWMITQSFGYFKGTFKDQLTLTLIETGTDTLNYSYSYYNSSNVKEGNISTLFRETDIYGFETSFAYFHRIKKMKNLFMGVALNWMYFISSDYWWSTPELLKKEGYRPFFGYRGSGNYSSSQLGISVCIKWSWRRFGVFTNIGNNIITTKREMKKGSFEWTQSNEPFHIFPTSHNFDFRFPLIFETGFSVYFDRIKR